MRLHSRIYACKVNRTKLADCILTIYGVPAKFAHRKGDYEIGEISAQRNVATGEDILRQNFSDFFQSVLFYSKTIES